jgi:hypothetical protein
MVMTYTGALVHGEVFHFNKDDKIAHDYLGLFCYKPKCRKTIRKRLNQAALEIGRPLRKLEWIDTDTTLGAKEVFLKKDTGKK